MALLKKIQSKLYREAVGLGRDIRHTLGISENYFKNARGSRILIYHGICAQDHTRFNPIFLTQKIFEKHLQLYKKYCNIISLSDYYLQRFSPHRFNVCLSFDDGFANNYSYVLPLLEAYRVPAIFFITAIRAAGYDVLWNDFLGILSKYGPGQISYKNEIFFKGQYNKYTSAQTGETLVEILRSAGFAEKAEMMELLYPLVRFKENSLDKDYWLQMTAEQVANLSQSPWVTIGAHGYYHNDLTRIDLAAASWEMLQSKLFLEKITGKSVNSLAFPYGAYTPPVVAAAKKAGYQQLLAMDFIADADHQDASLRERFTVNPFLSPVNQLHATITRRYVQ